MKYVIGVIPGESLHQVTRALGSGEIYRLTVSEVEVVSSGTGALPGDEERRLRLEVAVNDSFLEPALAAFRAVDDGNGDVWVSVLPVENVIRIRTEESGPEAI